MRILIIFGVKRVGQGMTRSVLLDALAKNALYTQRLDEVTNYLADGTSLESGAVGENVKMTFLFEPPKQYTSEMCITEAAFTQYWCQEYDRLKKDVPLTTESIAASLLLDAIGNKDEPQTKAVSLWSDQGPMELHRLLEAPRGAVLRLPALGGCYGALLHATCHHFGVLTVVAPSLWRAMASIPWAFFTKSIR